MSKFKVGDKVRIRKDLSTFIKYEVRVIPDMLPYKGEVATVTHIRTSPVSPDIYELDIDNGLWVWSEDTLEKLEFTKEALKPGYLVRLKDGHLYMAMLSQNGLALNDRIGWVSTQNLDENLCDLSDDNFSIVEVYGYSKYEYKVLDLDTSTRELLWKREEGKKEMTISEIEKELGYSIKIIKESEGN